MNAPQDPRRPDDAPAEGSADFIRVRVAADVEAGKNGARVHTRFPPEPNGFLHIGHAKSICIQHGLAKTLGGLFNLRMDDTNPIKEEAQFVESQVEDVRWLGADFEDRHYFASDYYSQLYDWAEQLVRQGDAFVCDLTGDEIREYRGTLTEPGRESPHRTRSVDENLDLFRRMRAGEFPDGSRTLRAKIDMASGNLNLRDPVMYRILHAHHHRTGDDWCIYPMYDWAHGQSDAIEGITHSICTLEFEHHRPLYDWFLERLGIENPPQQIEFAPLALTNTILSKRKLKLMVDEGHVSGWDDPRMPTISGMRRRGYTPEAVRGFCDLIGVSKRESRVDLALLEHSTREHLNKVALRVMGVLDPLRVVLTNYPEGQVEELDCINNPEDEGAGTRAVPFSRELFIERADFMEDPPKKFFRLAPGREVRLRYAYFIRCEEAIKNDAGEIVELRCTYDPATRGGNAPDGRKVKGTIHWVSAPHAIEADVRLFEHLFTAADPEDVEEGGSFLDHLNPGSVRVLEGARIEPSVGAWAPGTRCQFERQGYFCLDPDSRDDRLVFNRTVSLRDSWAKIEKAMAAGKR